MTKRNVTKPATVKATNTATKGLEFSVPVTLTLDGLRLKPDGKAAYIPFNGELVDGVRYSMNVFIPKSMLTTEQVAKARANYDAVGRDAVTTAEPSKRLFG